LRLMGPKARSAFPALSKGLLHKNPAVRQRAAEALLAIQPEYKDALPVILKFLKSEDAYLRGWTATFLSTFGGRASEQEPLIRSLIQNDPNPGVRDQAVAAYSILLKAHPLGNEPTDKARREAILSALKDLDVNVRAQGLLLVAA